MELGLAYLLGQQVYCDGQVVKVRWDAFVRTNLELSPLAVDPRHRRWMI